MNRFPGHDELHAMLDRVDVPGYPSASWDRRAAFLLWLATQGEPMAKTTVELARIHGCEIVDPYGPGLVKDWLYNGSKIAEWSFLDAWENIGRRTERMSITFLIYNVLTGECTTEAPTPELIESAYHAKWHVPPRGPEHVIAEIPLALGLNIHTYRQFPTAMIFEGVQAYARRKAREIVA